MTVVRLMILSNKLHMIIHVGEGKLVHLQVSTDLQSVDFAGFQSMMKFESSSIDVNKKVFVMAFDVNSKWAWWVNMTEVFVLMPPFSLVITIRNNSVLIVLTHSDVNMEGCSVHGLEL